MKKGFEQNPFFFFSFLNTIKILLIKKKRKESLPVPVSWEEEEEETQGRNGWSREKRRDLDRIEKKEERCFGFFYIFTQSRRSRDLGQVRGKWALGRLFYKSIL